MQIRQRQCVHKLALHLKSMQRVGENPQALAMRVRDTRLSTIIAAKVSGTTAIDCVVRPHPQLKL